MLNPKPVKVSYPWEPQLGPQSIAIQARMVSEVLMGGARGGGKSDFSLGDWLQDVQEYGPVWQGVLFRKTKDALDEIKKRAREIFPSTGARYVGSSNIYPSNSWIWDNGACLKFRTLERKEDAEKYHGHQYTYINWEELTLWRNAMQYYKILKGCLRATGDMPFARIRSTTNPLGPSHEEVKRYFVDVAPPFTPYADPVTGKLRMYIPAKVDDNKILMRHNPDYKNTLRGLGDEEVVKAWLHGDWNVTVGAFFKEFGKQHIIEPCHLPDYLTRFCAIDWGSARPACCLWFAVSDGTVCTSRGHYYPKGSLIVYRELYTADTKKVNIGLNWSGEQFCEKILELSHNQRISKYYADPSMIGKKDEVRKGLTMGQTFREMGIALSSANNAVISGCNQVRSRLNPRVTDDPDERVEPTLYFFNSCTNTIRTMGTIMRDDVNFERYDTDGEDHAVDCVRYGCNSHTYVSENPEINKLNLYDNSAISIMRQNGIEIQDFERY